MGREHLQVVEGEVGGGRESKTYDQAAEDAVIGVVLGLGLEGLDQVADFLRPEHFYSESRRRIFEAALHLRELGQPVDLVSVQSRLREVDRIAQIGGASELTRLAAEVPVEAALPGHLRAHGTKVRDLACRRDLGSTAKLIATWVETSATDVVDLVRKAQADLDVLAARLGGAETSDRADAVFPSMVKGLERVATTQGHGARPTGFPELDLITRGLHAELVLLGARPGMGKTSFATGIAERVATAGEGVYIASLETVRDVLSLRMACAHGGLPVERARVGELSEPEWARMRASAAALAKLPIWIDETSSLTVAELFARCRRVQLELARKKQKLGLVIVDYIQLLRAPRAGMKREEIVSESARGLRAMAQELGVTVLALSQLSRAVENRPDKHPQLSDLRESGELEQAARTVLLLHRDDYYQRKRKDYRPTGLVEVDIAKQNNGPQGRAWLHFDAPSTAFTSRTPEAEPAHMAACRCSSCRTAREDDARHAATAPGFFDDLVGEPSR